MRGSHHRTKWTAGSARVFALTLRMLLIGMSVKVPAGAAGAAAGAGAAGVAAGVGAAATAC